MTLRTWLVTVVTSVALLGFASAQEGTVVEIQMLGGVFDARFDPIGVHVQPGTTIRFVNVEYQHTSWSYYAGPGSDDSNRIPEGAAPWATPMRLAGGYTDIVVTVEGVYDFRDPAAEIMGMVGRIVVGDPNASPAKDPSELPERAQENLPPVDVILAQPDGLLSWDAWEAMKE